MPIHHHHLAVVATTLSLIGTGASAQTAVELSGGTLRLMTPNGDQSVRVEVGPAGEARVFGFPGLAYSQPFNGVTALDVVTGGGKDAVEIDIQSSQGLEVRVDTQGGDADTQVKWKILPGVGTTAATVRIASVRTGQQVATVEVDSETPNAAVSIDAGFASELSAKVSSSIPSESLRVLFNGRAPKSFLEVSSAASVLQVDLRGGVSASANELGYAVSQARPGSVSLIWDIATGAGADKIEAKVAAPGSTVTQRGLVRSAGGDDLLIFETEGFSTVTGLTLNGGGGADHVAQVIKGRFQQSQTLQTRLFGADGNDQLVLTTDTGIYGTGLPNDLQPIIDCGPGVDQFHAFGFIRGCEGRL